MKITTDLEIDVPTVPNYVHVAAIDNDRSARQSIDIGDLSDNALRTIAEKWTDALLQKAAERREMLYKNRASIKGEQ